MNIMNIKVCQLFVRILFFIFYIILLQNSYGNNADNNAALKETIIKITDKGNYSASMVFTKHGKQVITIENHSQKDIGIEDIYFIGDEFTAPPIARSISVSGYNSVEGGIIKAGTAYSFVIEASENASPTINPDGEQFILRYKDIEKGTYINIPFKIKIDYNNDVEFAIRNLEIAKPKSVYTCISGCSKGKYNFMDSAYNVYGKGTNSEYYEYRAKPSEQKLTIINRNKQYSIHIKNIQIPQSKHGQLAQNAPLRIEYSCSIIPSGESCDVNIIASDIYASNDVKPIYVEYDVVDKYNRVVLKDLTAVAAAIIDYNYKSETMYGRGIISGITTASTIKISYSDLVKNIFVVRIGENVARDSVIGLLAGVTYSSADGLNSGIDYFMGSKYDAANNNVNTMVETLTAHFLLGLSSCANRFYMHDYGLHYGSCIIATVGCALIANFGVKFIERILSSNTTIRLPEKNQSWFKTSLKNLKPVFNLGVAAAIRVVCKSELNLENDGIIEIGQDTLSGISMAAIDYMVGLISNSEQLSLSQTNTTDAMRNYYACNSEECVCYDDLHFKPDEYTFSQFVNALHRELFYLQ